jgi:hypothetical protein
MPVTAGPIYPGIKDGLVFAIDPANKDSWVGPTSNTVDNLPTYNSNISGSIFNDTSGSFGNDESFAFDGSDDYILTNYLGINAVTKCTISIWAKTSNVIEGNFLYGNRDSNPFPGIGCQTWTDGRIYFYVASNAFLYFNMANAGIQNNNWFNLVFVFNGSGLGNIDKVKIYVNSNIVNYTNSSNFPSSLENSSRTLTIGYEQAANSYWNGDIGNFQIYNRALSSTEILHNYNALKGRFE